MAFKMPTVASRVGYPAVTNVTNAFRPCIVSTRSQSSGRTLCFASFKRSSDLQCHFQIRVVVIISAAIFSRSPRVFMTHRLPDKLPDFPGFHGVFCHRQILSLGRRLLDPGRALSCSTITGTVKNQQSLPKKGSG
jgi:hypothetical protein